MSARPERLWASITNVLNWRLHMGGVVTIVLTIAVLWSEPGRGMAIAAGAISVIAMVLQTNWVHRAMDSAAPAIVTLLQRLLMLALVLMLIHSGDRAALVVLIQGFSEIGAALVLLVLLKPRLSQTGCRMWATTIGVVARSVWPLGVTRALRGLSIAAMTVALSFVWDDGETAYFGVALRVASLLTLVGTAFGIATFPGMARASTIGGEAELRSIIAAFRLLAIVVVAPAAGGIMLAQPLISHAVTDAYAPATRPLQVLFATMLLMALSDQARRVLQARLLQRQDLVYVCVASIVTLASATILLPTWGAIGASWALLIGEFVLLLLAWQALFRGRKVLVALWDTLGLAFVASGLVIACIAAMTSMPFPVGLSVGALVYLAVLWFWRKTIITDLASLEVPRS